MTAEKKTKKPSAKKETTSKKAKTTGTVKAGAVKGPAKKTVKKSRKKPAFKDMIREKLLNDKDKILSDVSTKIRQESREQKRGSGDIYDIASDERERELSLTLGDRDRQKLSEIELALERIQDGSYGYCEDCGEPVGEKRLEVLPFTRVCVECKSRYEREQRVRGASDEDDRPQG